MARLDEALLDELARRAGLTKASRPVLLGALALVVALAGWALWRWWPRSIDVAEPAGFEAGPTQASVENSDPAATVESTPQATTVVHVTGAVRRPGVYTLPSGSRVTDAVEEAGGLLPDAVPEQVNLARVVADGEQIHVPDEDDPLGQSAPVAPPASGAVGSAGGLVNLNVADATQLDTLPGVGPATAAKIVADREANGPFASVDDLGRVSGIGPKRLDDLRELVTVN